MKEKSAANTKNNRGKAKVNRGSTRSPISAQAKHTHHIIADAVMEDRRLFQGILQSSSDGILAVNRENEVLFANDRFVEMWMIPQDVLASKDDTRLLQYVLDQLINPQDFLQKVQELYDSTDESFDTLHFKDGRMFDRFSRPILQESELHGRVWSFRDITEYKRAEEKLAASEAELRALFASMQDVVLVIDREGVYRRIAPTNPRLLVKPPNELVGKNLRDVFSAEKADVFRGVVQRVLDTKQNDQIEYELIIAGQTVWLQTTISPLDAGSTLWVAHDISNRKRAEQALQESETHFHSLFDNATVGMYRTTPNGRIILSNLAGVRLLGYDSFNEIAKRDLEAEGFEPTYERRQFHERMKKEGSIVGLESAWKRKDGSTIYVRESATAVKDGNGNIIYYDGTFEDITERKQAEQALQRAQQRYRSLFEDAPAMYVITRNIEGSPVIVDCNELFLHTLGFSRDELLGQPVSDLYSPASRIHLVEGGYQRALAGKFETEEREFVARDGRIIPTMVRAVPEIDDTGRVSGTRAMFIDISERKKVEEELQFRNILLSTQQEASIDGILVVDEKAHILTYNRRFVEMMGIPARLVEERVDEPVLQFVTSRMADPQTFLQRVQYFYEHNQESGLDELILVDGQIFDRYTAPMFGPDGRYFGRVWYFHDVTERRQAEDELRRAKDELETLSVELQQLLEYEKLVACTDGLTGLYNHRHFFELAAREFHAATRHQHALAFLMFDMDGFKKVNDTLGHAIGDKLLSTVAQTAVAQVRASDVVARYGGDEFIIMLPHASAQQVLPVAERIRRAVANLVMDTAREPFTITLSIGIADARHEPADENVERVIQRADRALYKAKQNGRNRTVIYDAGEETDFST